MDDDLKALARTSVREALLRSSDDLGTALGEFGWLELAEADEAFAFSALFEEQGQAATEAGALDVVWAGLLGLEGASVLWPAAPPCDAGATSTSGQVRAEGITLRGVRAPGVPLLVPAGERLVLLESPTVDEEPLGGMALGSGWCRVRAGGPIARDLGPWADVERRSRLALASELAGVAGRILEVAAEQVSTRRQFGQPIGVNQSVRFRLAESYADVVGAKALVASAWEDGSAEPAAWAKAVAGSAHDLVAKHAMQVCGAIGLSEEHPLPALVRRGQCLDALLGSATDAQAKLGRDLWSDGPVPAAVGGF